MSTQIVGSTSKVGRFVDEILKRDGTGPVTITWPGTDLEPVRCVSMWAATDFLEGQGFYEPGMPLHQFS